MSDSYRGIPLPEVSFDNGWYYIADERFGWFEGYIESAALLHWKNKVDHDLFQKFVEDGLYHVYENGTVMCTRCGSQVLDVFLHNDSHRA